VHKAPVASSYIGQQAPVIGICMCHVVLRFFRLDWRAAGNAKKGRAWASIAIDLNSMCDPRLSTRREGNIPRRLLHVLTMGASWPAAACVPRDQLAIRSQSSLSPAAWHQWRPARHQVPFRPYSSSRWVRAHALGFGRSSAGLAKAWAQPGRTWRGRGVMSSLSIHLAVRIVLTFASSLGGKYKK
jgi:hypothetical protein